MILTLEVVGEQAEVLGPARRKVFDSIGGTIGRLPDNDWVFPDPYVSGRHALIRYLNGKFFVEDTSTNGVFVNSPDNRLPRDQSYQLKNGDLLYIDAYCIQVRIEKPSRAKEDANDPLDLLKAHALGGYTDKTVAMRDAEIDRTASLRPTSEEARTEWLFDSDVAAPAAIQAEERPVARAHTGAQTNATARTATRAPNGDPMQALLDSAGITDVEPSAELGQTLGEVLRTTLAGIMEALRARERVKDDLRLPGTSFQPQHNNPLKFSANVADAFHNLLVKRNPAYLSPPAAVDEALRDLRDHQSAIVAAMRVAFAALLARFDPARLQQDFDRQMKKGSILGVPAKLRYWDLYREKYGEMTQDAETSFHELFVEEFARAYEDQLRRLQALARNRQS